ncbi:allantoate amidohydrolase [Virgibacillus phasianinus]|uniref:Allantoate amidohydrolase n=1 Tax=Virgibacillus phasianinus TaxID=2017483 RepID=A0A220TYY7_9BACI|nr:M20 family metallo-hydrolase [Virgibacillus phasianinus]ASK60979.1 allantoate amidohydrolase [Virgibacillus phasianinus]
MPYNPANELFNQLMKPYNLNLDHSGIKGERIAARLFEQSKIGFTKDGGVKRPGFSEEEKQAKQLVKTWMREAGLKVREDGAGNVIGRLSGVSDDLPAVASGSHVDSVPNGGHFDGPVGVLSALEVAESWKETNYQPKKPYEIIVFTDEEGSRFNSGLTGSMAMTGSGGLSAKSQLNDYNGDSFEKVLHNYGSSLEEFKKAKRDMKELEMFVEVHIEQGKKLEQDELPVGIVSGIAGPAWLEITFTGEAGHAGNTPMIGRKDPLTAAGAFLQKVEEFPGQVSETAVATIGKLNVSPNGINVIPQQVTLNVDIRDIHEETRDRLLKLITQEAEQIAEKRGIGIDMKQTTKIQPIPIKEELQNKLAASISKHDLQPSYIPSGAGHDAMMLGREIPVAMLFVRSKDGISHNPKEWSSLSDIVTTVHVLKEFIEGVMDE